MTVLHRADIPDKGKEDSHVYIGDLTCKHCGQQLQAGDAFTIGDDGYKNRMEFEVCTPEAVDKG